MQTIPFTSHRDVFERLAKVSSVAALSAEERLQYDYDIKKARDYKEEMRAARDEGMQKGIAEGMQKGIAEGRAEERLSIARSMKEKGLDTATILSITGISEAELATL